MLRNICFGGIEMFRIWVRMELRHAVNVAHRAGELGQLIVAVAGPADSPIFIGG